MKSSSSAPESAASRSRSSSTGAASPAACSSRRRRSRRSASASTSCRTRRGCSPTLGLQDRARRGRGRDRRGGVLQPLRPAHLPRAARQARRAIAGRSSRSTAATCRSVLLEAVKARLGADRLHLGSHLRRVRADRSRSFRSSSRIDRQPRGLRAIACDGIHSVIRRQLYPDEGEPRYSGINMWRGVTRWKPILSGATMTARRVAEGRQAGALPDPQQRSTRRAGSS